MVADEVRSTRTAPGATRPGAGRRTARAPSLAPLPLENAPERGTGVACISRRAPQRISAAADPREHRARTFRRGRVPIDAHRKARRREKRRDRRRRARSGRSPKDKIEEQYTEFYRGALRPVRRAALTIHCAPKAGTNIPCLPSFPARGRSICSIPRVRAATSSMSAACSSSSDTDLLPGWLRFVALVVDSAPTCRSTSRARWSEEHGLRRIRKAVTNRVVQEIAKLAEKEPEKFAKIWEHFGPFSRKAVRGSRAPRSAVQDRALRHIDEPEGKRTLKEYVAALRPNQTAIYYLTGEDASALRRARSSKGSRAAASKCCFRQTPSTRSGSRPQWAMTASRSSR